MIDVEALFPGDPMAYPTDKERDRADDIVGYKLRRTREGRLPYFVNPATNRAYLRSQVRRWAARNAQ